MKNLMRKFSKSKFKSLGRNNRGQGMLEYILLIVVVAGLFVILKPYMTTKLEGLKGQIDSSIGSVLGN